MDGYSFTSSLLLSPSSLPWRGVVLFFSSTLVEGDFVPLLLFVEREAVDEGEELFVCDSQGRDPVLDVFGSLVGVESWELLDLITKRARGAEVKFL